MTTKSWVMTKAVMVPTEQSEEEAVGFIFIAGSSPWGVRLAYYLVDDRWNQGYASAAAKQFLEEYWNEPRFAPSHEIYCVYDDIGNVVENTAEKKDETLVEIGHLIAEVDFDNIGSMRVAEKSGAEMIATFVAKLYKFEELRKHAVWQINKPSQH